MARRFDAGFNAKVNLELDFVTKQHKSLQKQLNESDMYAVLSSLLSLWRTLAVVG